MAKKSKKSASKSTKKKVQNNCKVFYTCDKTYFHGMGETVTRVYKIIKELKATEACVHPIYVGCCNILKLTVVAEEVL